jgi:hypothetical protein
MRYKVAVSIQSAHNDCCKTKPAKQSHIIVGVTEDVIEDEIENVIANVRLSVTSCDSQPCHCPNDKVTETETQLA